jgi:hypothetical protein
MKRQPVLLLILAFLTALALPGCSNSTNSETPAAPGTPGSDDATLSRLRPAGPNKLLRQHLVPQFAAAAENYTLSVDYWVDTFQLEATLTEAGAALVSSAAHTTNRSEKVFTLSYALNKGDNNITIKVTAPDGIAAKTYAIVINRDTFYDKGAENVIPSWLLGYWSFVFSGNGDYEAVTITDKPLVSGDNLGRLEFGMPWSLWIAGDIVYTREFGSRSGMIIIRLDPGAVDFHPIDDPTPDGTGYYAVYYFDKVGDGGPGSTARIFQSNQIGSGGGVNAYATLEEAKEKFMVDNWHTVNLTTIDAVGDPQIKRPDGWEWDGTIDYWED